MLPRKDAVVQPQNKNLIEVESARIQHRKCANRRACRSDDSEFALTQDLIDRVGELLQRQATIRCDPQRFNRKFI